MSGASVLLGVGMPGPGSLLIILLIAVLLYGERLPEVARKFGRGFAEFKKGLDGIERELHSAMNAPISSSSSSSSALTYASESDADDREEATAPKFEPPASEPQVAAADAQSAAQPTGSELVAKTVEG